MDIRHHPGGRGRRARALPRCRQYGDRGRGRDPGVDELHHEIAFGEEGDRLLTAARANIDQEVNRAREELRGKVAAIAVASLGWVYLPVALGCVVAAYIVLSIVPIRDVYSSIEWPVIVLLGSMIPIGGALETTGGTVLIAQGIVEVSAGYSPVIVLALLIMVTMTLSDVMNNTATAVIAAPIAVEIAARLGVSPDPFLMGVAVAASCAFLTPIGHKNNTLIMGPGGYRFGDYWRMGLPLEILIVIVSVPTLVTFWPL